jgi:hypothetical protein
VIDAARVIASHHNTVDRVMEDAELLGFVGLDSLANDEGVDVPLDQWHPSVRDQKRREVREFEACYRAGALRDAALILARYQTRSTPSPTYDTLWRFLGGDLPVPEFEQWVYADPALEAMLGPELYLTVIETDYRSQDAIERVKAALWVFAEQRDPVP